MYAAPAVLPLLWAPKKNMGQSVGFVALQAMAFRTLLRDGVRNVGSNGIASGHGRRNAGIVSLPHGKDFSGGGFVSIGGCRGGTLNNSLFCIPCNSFDDLVNGVYPKEEIRVGDPAIVAAKVRAVFHEQQSLSPVIAEELAAHAHLELLGSFWR